MNRSLVITLIASVLVLALGVAGLGAYVMLRPSSAVPAAAPAAAKKTDPVFYNLKSFVTDLGDKDRPRYVDVTVSLAMKDQTAVDDSKKIEPQLRDIILSQLRNRMAADLLGVEGKDQLAKTLKESLTPVLKDQLQGVYITDLVIQ